MDLNLSAITGLTVTAQLYLGETATGSPISVPEIGETGEYAANIPEGTAAGEYLVVFSTTSGKLGAGTILWDGLAEVTATRAELAVELAAVRFLLKVLLNEREMTNEDLIVYDDDGVTPILLKALSDITGNPINAIAAGIAVREGKSRV